ncbi:ATP-binding protein [Halobacteriovorax sp.]|uniref:sensor histidine kinase n=1 Tax=Halobacteriovorax sp. TaxID=2020862 RepID=UPI00356A6C06
MSETRTDHFINTIPWRFFKRIALSQIVLTTIVILITVFSARYYLKVYITNQSLNQVTESLELIKHSITTQNIDPIKWCKSLKLNWSTRYTLIDIEGNVLCDNYIDIKNLDNHLYRPEVQDAIKKGLGTTERYSNSLESDMIYGAISFNTKDSNFIIRQAVPLKQIAIAMERLDRSILLFFFPLLIVTSLLSLWTSLQVSFPLRSLVKKISNLKNLKLTPKGLETAIAIDDEWHFVERTLDRAELELANYVEELQLENKKFSILMESNSDAILAIDNNENVLFINKRYYKNFISEERSKIIQDKKDLKLLEVSRKFEVHDLLRDALKDKASAKVRNIEIEMVGRSEKGWFDITTSPLISDDGHTLGAICTFRNISHKKLADQMREDFVTNVSHEVRTPLTAMKGYVQILQGVKEVSDNKIVKEALSKIEHNSNRLTLLFQEILNLSVIESKHKLYLTKTFTEDITQTVLLNLKQVHSENDKEVECIFNVKTVYIDAALIEQVLTNLVDNSYKYGNKNGHIIIRWEPGEKEFNLYVEDDGPGIEPSHQKRIFERFYRADSSRSRNLGGTGLGLSIVKHIVQKHKGTITTFTNDKGGISFKITIPQTA